MSDYPWGNFFTNRNTAVGVRIDEVSEFWATLIVQAQLISTFKMPREQYDTHFVEQYIPLDTGSMRVPDNFVPPKNWERWLEEGITSRAVPRLTADDSRDEDEVDVDRISAEEEAREQREVEAPEVTVAPRSGSPDPKNVKVDKDPAEIEAAVQARLASR
jgi:hypothetical protein